MTRAEVLALQHELNRVGYGPLKVDGLYGPATATAYQRMLDVLPAPPPAKPWWQSKALLGALATLIASGVSLLGVEIDAGQLSQTLTAIVGAVAAVVALWGTVMRKAPIDPGLVVPGLRLESGRLRRAYLSPDDGSGAGRYWTTDRGPLAPGD